MKTIGLCFLCCLCLWYLIQENTARSNLWNFGPMFSSKSFIVLALTFRSLIHFMLILHMVLNEDPKWFFCMWIFSFQSWCKVLCPFPYPCCSASLCPTLFIASSSSIFPFFKVNSSPLWDLNFMTLGSRVTCYMDWPARCPSFSYS